jgi:hypothetical protein
MHVRVVEAGDDGSSAPVNYVRVLAPQAQNFFILANSGYFSCCYGDSFYK